MPRGPHRRLEVSNVLRLEALRAFFHFKLHRLTFIQGLVTVHGDRGEVYENIFSRLALDESVTLRSIEPLHCSLFLHCHYLDIGIALPLLVRLPGQRCAANHRPTPSDYGPGFPSPATSSSLQKKAAKFVLAAPRTSQKVLQAQQTLIEYYHKMEPLSTARHGRRSSTIS